MVLTISLASMKSSSSKSSTPGTLVGPREINLSDLANFVGDEPFHFSLFLNRLAGGGGGGGGGGGNSGGGGGGGRERLMISLPLLKTWDCFRRCAVRFFLSLRFLEVDEQQ